MACRSACALLILALAISSPLAESGIIKKVSKLSTAASPDRSCPDGQVADCDGSGECHSKSWIGDTYCDGDAQQWDANLCCYQYDMDDCTAAQCADTPPPESICFLGSSDSWPTGYVADCSGDGDCIPESFLGDGVCDGVDQPFGGDLTCYEAEGETDCAGGGGFSPEILNLVHPVCYSESWSPPLTEWKLADQDGSQNGGNYTITVLKVAETSCGPCNSANENYGDGGLMYTQGQYADKRVNVFQYLYNEGYFGNAWTGDVCGDWAAAAPNGDSSTIIEGSTAISDSFEGFFPSMTIVGHDMSILYQGSFLYGDSLQAQVDSALERCGDLCTTACGEGVDPPCTPNPTDAPTPYSNGESAAPTSIPSEAPTSAPSEAPTSPPSEAPTEESLIPEWAIQALLGITAAVVIAVLLSVAFAEPEEVTQPEDEAPPTSQPTFLESVQDTVSGLLGLGPDQVTAGGERRGDATVININAANPTEAYNVMQILTTTSGSTVTTMLVQQLQANNYTGPMPTMVTTVIQQVTSAGGSSSSDSDNTLIAVVVIVAAVLLLVAVLVVAALFYMFKQSKQTAAQTQAAAPPSMGNVGVVMNPIHKEENAGGSQRRSPRSP